MSDQKENPIWPMPKFYFQVNWRDATMSFSEVSGLDSGDQTIEYKHGNSPIFYPIKMPGLGKVGNVTLKRGTFVGDQPSEWLSQIKMNTIAKEDVTIKLVNEKGNASMQWTLKNAWPTKITSTDTEDGNSIAIETLEVAYETLEISSLNS